MCLRVIAFYYMLFKYLASVVDQGLYRKFLKFYAVKKAPQNGVLSYHK